MKILPVFSFSIILLTALNSLGMETNNNPDEQESTIIDLDTICYFGFKPRKLLDIALGKKEIKIFYPNKNESTTGTIEISSTAKTARLVLESSKLMTIFPEDKVEIDAKLTFTSEDGAFVEEWPIILESRFDVIILAKSKLLYLIPGKFAKFNLSFSSNQLNGSFYMNEEEPVNTWKFYMHIQKDGTISGEIYGQYEKEGGIISELVKVKGAIIGNKVN